MKRCPACNHVETDDTLKFCRVDGATLIRDLSPIDGDKDKAFDELEKSFIERDL
jgi:hypothetical protein